MTNDDENHQPHTPETPPAGSDIAALTVMLEDMLVNPPVCDNLFERQAEVLDSLFYAVLRDNLAADKKSGAFNARRLDLALRIQRQSLDAARAYTASAYMETMTSLQAERQRLFSLQLMHDRPHVFFGDRAPSHPPPPENDERTR